MEGFRDHSWRAAAGPRTRFAAFAAVLLFGLAGCSAVPDYANPVEWYKGTVEYFVGDDTDSETSADTSFSERAAEHGDGPFPRVSDTPDVPKRAKTVEELEDIEEGLIADREHARYTDEVIRRDSEGELTATKPPPVGPDKVVSSSDTDIQSAAAPKLGTPPQDSVVARPTTAPAVRPEAPLPAGERRAVATPVTVPMASSLTTPVPTESGGDLDVREQFKSLFASSGPYATMSSRGPPSRENSGANRWTPVPMTPETAGPTVSIQAAVISFERGSSALSLEGRDALGTVAALHRERGGTVRVIGHASSRTRELSLEKHKLANFSISVDRARVVASELIRAGVKARDVFPSALADQERIYFEWMPSGESGNQRVEVFLDY